MRTGHEAGSAETGPDIFEDTRQLAARTNTSTKFWERRRLKGDGPEFVRIGARKVLYRRSVTDAYLAARTFPHRAAEAVAKQAT